MSPLAGACGFLSGLTIVRVASKLHWSEAARRLVRGRVRTTVQNCHIDAGYGGPFIVITRDDIIVQNCRMSPVGAR